MAARGLGEGRKEQCVCGEREREVRAPAPPPGRDLPPRPTALHASFFESPTWLPSWALAGGLGCRSEGIPGAPLSPPPLPINGFGWEGR